jgi:hypothetical protein
MHCLFIKRVPPTGAPPQAVLTPSARPPRRPVPERCDLHRLEQPRAQPPADPARVHLHLRARLVGHALRDRRRRVPEQPLSERSPLLLLQHPGRPRASSYHEVIMRSSPGPFYTPALRLALTRSWRAASAAAPGVLRAGGHGPGHGGDDGHVPARCRQDGLHRGASGIIHQRPTATI